MIGLAVTAVMISVWGARDTVMAADYQLITSVAGIYEYNDNIRLNSGNQLSDSIYTVAPKLEVIREGERLSARADATAEFYDYQEYDEYDDVDQWYNGSLEYAASERWQFAFDGYASRDNRPDRDIEETGLVLSNIRRKRFGGGGTASYRLSELTSLGLNVSFNRENFDDPQTSDRMDYHAMLFATRSLDAWLRRTTGRLDFAYSHYEFDRDYNRLTQTKFLGTPVNATTEVGDRMDVDSYALTLGTESALTELLSLTVNAGGRYSRSESESTVHWSYDPPITTRSPVDDTQDADNWGFVGTLQLDCRGERSRYALLLSHDLQPTSGENGTANRTTVRLGGSLRLLEKLRGNLAFQWHRNKSDQSDSQDEIDTMTWNARVWLTWELNNYLALDGGYAYTFYDDRDGDTTAYRNKVLMQLTARHDWLE